MRIAIEGMDGSGKTTVSKILAQKLGYKYLDKPFKFLYERDKQDRDLSNCAMYKDGYEKMEKFLQNIGFKYIVIDTEALLPEEVADIVIKNIKLINQKKVIEERE